MKRSMVVVVMVLFLVVGAILGVPLSARADTDVATARIDMIGMYYPNETRGAMVMLTDLSATPKWTGQRQFFLSQAVLGNQGLAVLLTAYSMGQTIWVRIAGAADPASLILVVYANNN
jgi:hypothetical protein